MMITNTIKANGNDKPFKLVRDYKHKTKDFSNARVCSSIPVDKALCLTPDQFEYVRILQEENAYFVEHFNEKKGYTLVDILLASVVSVALTTLYLESRR